MFLINSLLLKPWVFHSRCLRATPTGVAIRGDIPITAKITPQRQKNQALTEVASEVTKCHPAFWGDIFDNFREGMERLQNSN